MTYAIDDGTVLATYPDTTGVPFDLPHVAAGVDPDPRLKVVAGDFFTDPLPACDAYLLMNVIHDWDDTDTVAILTAVANAGRTAAGTELLTSSSPPGGNSTAVRNLHRDRRASVLIDQTQPPYAGVHYTGKADTGPEQLPPSSTPQLFGRYVGDLEQAARSYEVLNSLGLGRRFYIHFRPTAKITWDFGKIPAAP